MTYEPKPIPTESVELGKDILELTELLAKNVHEIWAEKRINEGWRYGQTRNDEKLEHPCLVPYDELPDSEKEYDRKMVLLTVKAILGLGFRIEK